MVMTLIGIVMNTYSNVSDDVTAIKGWWFYDVSNNDVNKSEYSNNDDCTNPLKWTISCGFIKPTNYEFEQKQYQELIRWYAMNANSVEAVYQFQRFNFWAVSQAMTASYVWQFNLAQHPELDTSIKVPISQFANAIVTNINQSSRNELFKLLSTNSILVFFTRSNCLYCHQQSPIILNLSMKTGIPVWNVSLDDNAMPNYARIIKAPQSTAPAKVLQVNIVPTLFLYLSPIDKKFSGQWIRVATGLVTSEVIEERIANFVQAFRNAIVKGYEQGQHQQSMPDFSKINE